MVEKLINTNTHFSDNIISRKELEVVPGVKSAVLDIFR